MTAELGGCDRSVKPGQFVIGSFFASDNRCPHCRQGYQTSCEHSQPVVGAQAPRMRSGPVTSCGLRRERSIGTELGRPRP